MPLVSIRDQDTLDVADFDNDRPYLPPIPPSSTQNNDNFASLTLLPSFHPGTTIHTTNGTTDLNCVIQGSEDVSVMTIESVFQQQHNQQCSNSQNNVLSEGGTYLHRTSSSTNNGSSSSSGGGGAGGGTVASASGAGAGVMKYSTQIFSKVGIRPSSLHANSHHNNMNLSQHQQQDNFRQLSSSDSNFRRAQGHDGAINTADNPYEAETNHGGGVMAHATSPVHPHDQHIQNTPTHDLPSTLTTATAKTAIAAGGCDTYNNSVSTGFHYDSSSSPPVSTSLETCRINNSTSTNNATALDSSNHPYNDVDGINHYNNSSSNNDLRLQTNVPSHNQGKSDSRSGRANSFAISNDGDTSDKINKSNSQSNNATTILEMDIAKLKFELATSQSQLDHAQLQIQQYQKSMIEMQNDLTRVQNEAKQYKQKIQVLEKRGIVQRMSGTRGVGSSNSGGGYDGNNGTSGRSHQSNNNGFLKKFCSSPSSSTVITSLSSSPQNHHFPQKSNDYNSNYNNDRHDQSGQECEDNGRRGQERLQLQQQPNDPYHAAAQRKAVTKDGFTTASTAIIDTDKYKTPVSVTATRTATSVSPYHVALLQRSPGDSDDFSDNAGFFTDSVGNDNIDVDIVSADGNVTRNAVNGGSMGNGVSCYSNFNGYGDCTGNGNKDNTHCDDDDDITSYTPWQADSDDDGNSDSNEKTQDCWNKRNDKNSNNNFLKGNKFKRESSEKSGVWSNIRLSIKSGSNKSFSENRCDGNGNQQTSHHPKDEVFDDDPFATVNGRSYNGKEHSDKLQNDNGGVGWTGLFRFNKK